MNIKKVLFVCIHNSGRSQMAEAFFNHIGGKRVIAFSAGTRPSEQIDPVVAYVMRETGIDISQQRPKLLTIEMMENASKVITMGCGVEETSPAGLLPTEDWDVEDPTGKSVPKVKEIRDIIRENVESLVKELYLEAQLELKGCEK